MSSNNKNISYLFIGIFTGLVLGGTFGWLLKPVQTFEKKILTFRPDSIFHFKHHGDKEEFTKQNLNELEKTQNEKPGKNNEFYSKNYDSSQDKFLDSLDNIVQKNRPDSISSKHSNEDNFVIRTDKLLFVKESNIVKTKNQKLDSLLTDATSGTQKTTVKIEFWLSPVNYQGYKMTEDKLIIFGINDYTETNLIVYNNVYYLKNHATYYPVENSVSFKPLLRLTNSSLISQLNSYCSR